MLLLSWLVQVIYCGTIVTDEGKERRVNIDFEPFKPINTSLYLCDNKFHTEARREARLPPPNPTPIACQKAHRRASASG